MQAFLFSTERSRGAGRPALCQLADARSTGRRARRSFALRQLTVALTAMTRAHDQTGWHPASWHGRKAVQQPSYPQESAVEAVLADLSRLPPLVVSGEVEALKQQIAEAQQGHRFLLQGAIARRVSTSATRTASPRSSRSCCR